MELKRALRILKIDELIEQKTEEATELFHHGLVEGGQAMCEAITELKRFLEKKEK